MHPRLGENDDSPFAAFFIVSFKDIFSGSYPFGFWVIIFSNKGGKRSETATAGSGVSSIDLFAQPAARTLNGVS